MSDCTFERPIADPGLTPPSFRPGRWLIAIMLLGAWLRCSQGNEALWLDELHTSWVVADGLDQVAPRARAGNQSPLYFYVVWGVARVCGQQEWTLRLSSWIAGIALIGVVFSVVRQWTGSAASGLFVALLMALNRDAIFFAQEARPYALLQLSAALHAAAFAALIERPTGARRAVVVGGAAWLFYLHYTAFLFLLAEAACLAGRWIGGRRRLAYRPSQFAADALLVGLLLAPALPHLRQIALHRENWARIVHGWPPAESLQLSGALYVVLPVVGIVLGHALRLAPSRFRLASLCGLWTLCWFAVPTLLAWLSTLSGLAALGMMRYLVASLVGAIVFAGLCHAAHASRSYRWTFALVLVAATVATSGMVQQWMRDGRWIGDRNERWNDAVAWLQEQIDRSPAPVFLCPGLLEDRVLQTTANEEFRDYCLFSLQGIYRLNVDRPRCSLEALPTTRDLRLTQRQKAACLDGGAWFVVRARRDKTNQLLASVAASLGTPDQPGRIVQQRRFGDLTIAHIVP